MGTDKRTEAEWETLEARMKTGPGPSGNHFIEDLKATVGSANPALPAPPGALDLEVDRTRGEKPAETPPPPPSPPNGGGSGEGKGNGGGSGEESPQGERGKFSDSHPFLAILLYMFCAAGLIMLLSWVHAKYRILDGELEEKRLATEIKIQQMKNQAGQLGTASASSGTSSMTGGKEDFGPCHLTKEVREKEGIYFPDGCRTIALDPNPQHPEIYLKVKQGWSFRGSYAIYTYINDEVRSNEARTVWIPILHCQTRSTAVPKYSSNNCASELATLSYPANVSIQFDSTLTISR